ncbi:MAG: hypothetical protein HXY38_09135 [Chloroflexi bacterium]|nr:hypothetical protein [Chloroflexota bacterium]
MEICYLIAFPDSAEKHAPPEQFTTLKDAPYFKPVDIDLVTLGEETVVIEGYAVTVSRQRYDGQVQMVECHYDLEDPFDPALLKVRMKIQNALQSRFVPEVNRVNGMYEEYSILLVQTAKPSPDKWVEKNAVSLATFIRSQRETLDSMEIEELLGARVHYSSHEMTVVDWEGAIIIAPNADYQSDIALIKIGNYQLLRYRMLDQSIAEMLDKIRETFFGNQKRVRATRGIISQIAQHKLEIMLDFERAEQSLLLIGDWYTADLYEAIHEQFYLKDWKESVKTKLDNLENIMQTIKDNLSISWEHLMDQIQLILWMIMLFGYLYLYLLDAGWIKLQPR